MDIRLTQIHDWLTNGLGYRLDHIEPASADASFRRYFRATSDKHTFIVMDAPPDKEPLDDFLSAAAALAELGIHTPAVHHRNLDLGFLVLEDLGTRTYLDELTANPDALYGDAIRALIKLQGATTQKNSKVGSTTQEAAPAWPAYDQTKLLEEINLFNDWYLQRHLSIEMDQAQQQCWQSLKQTLVASCQEQPQVWVHRDYHSRNLMITHQNSPGVIDFQDIVVGPISYDLVSLFKDCYISWPREQQLGWLSDYYHCAERDFSLEQLIRWYDFTGLQRHLKVLGIFCRLHYRDGKAHYLNDLPLVAQYVIEVLDHYSEFADAKEAFSGIIKRSL